MMVRIKINRTHLADSINFIKNDNVQVTLITCFDKVVQNQMLKRVHATQKYDKAPADEISYLVPSVHFQHQETNLSHSSLFLQQICSTLRVHSQSEVGERYLTSSKHDEQVSGIVLAGYM